MYMFKDDTFMKKGKQRNDTCVLLLTFAPFLNIATANVSADL